jgi:predicted transposase YdaD
LEISKLEGEELKMYRKSMRNIDERQLVIDFAEKKSEAKGIAKGRREGRAKGVAVGEARGFMKAAKSMLADGLSPARVARITKLPKKQIMAML